MHVCMRYACRYVVCLLVCLHAAPGRYAGMQNLYMQLCCLFVCLFACMLFVCEFVCMQRVGFAGMQKECMQVCFFVC